VYAAWVAGSDRKASEMPRAADDIALRILRDCAGRSTISPSWLRADSADGRAGHRNRWGAAPASAAQHCLQSFHWAKRVNERDSSNQPIVWLLGGRDAKAALPRATNERECR
jgi:hypothetical protein